VLVVKPAQIHNRGKQGLSRKGRRWIVIHNRGSSVVSPVQMKKMSGMEEKKGGSLSIKSKNMFNALQGH
jgi:hypothetical protein